MGFYIYGNNVFFRLDPTSMETSMETKFIETIGFHMVFLQCFYIYGNNIDFKMFPSTNPMKIDEAIARRISKARRPFQRRIRRFPLRRLGRKCDSPGTTF